MDVKKLALLVGALVIAVVTAIMAKNMFTGASAPQAAPLRLRFRSARRCSSPRRRFPVGTIIDADSFSYQPWPKELMQEAYYVEGAPDSAPGTLMGQVVRYPITAGQPVAAARSSAPKTAASSPLRLVPECAPSRFP